MKIQKRWALGIALAAISFLMNSLVVHARDESKIRWDIVTFQPPAFSAGGIASARANDGSKITFTGSGTFEPGDPGEVTGGGIWMISGGGSGTYKVKELIRFDQAPGQVPPGIIDKIGNVADAHSGLAVLRIAYSDGSRGILVVGCHLPVGTPPSLFEGITASKGFVNFWNREAPSDSPFVDANRTAFHVLREGE